MNLTIDDLKIILDWFACYKNEAMVYESDKKLKDAIEKEIEIKVPKLANIKKGESYDIYIGRENKWLNLPESKWKNPFPMKKESERPDVLLKHWEYMKEHPELIVDLKELEGKTLGCYCFSSAKNEGKKCHGHNLITLFEMYVK